MCLLLLSTLLSFHFRFVYALPWPRFEGVGGVEEQQRRVLVFVAGVATYKLLNLLLATPSPLTPPLTLLNFGTYSRVVKFCAWQLVTR